LLTSARQAGQIRRGRLKPGRVTSPPHGFQVFELPRKPLGLVLAAIFGVLALIDWAQVLLALLGISDLPSALTALHFGTGAAAAATCWGSWRRTRWTPIAAIAYGVLTAALLLTLPALLHLPSEARTGIRGGAVAVVVFALLSAAYFRAHAARETREPIATERANLNG
jgi:hypothetical protein